jgi:hypothetical protein
MKKVNPNSKVLNTVFEDAAGKKVKLATWNGMADQMFAKVFAFVVS